MRYENFKLESLSLSSPISFSLLLSQQYVYFKHNSCFSTLLCSNHMLCIKKIACGTFDALKVNKNDNTICFYRKCQFKYMPIAKNTRSINCMITMKIVYRKKLWICIILCTLMRICSIVSDVSSNVSRHTTFNSFYTLMNLK